MKYMDSGKKTHACNYMTQCFILYQQSKSHDQTVANYTAPSIDDFTFIDIEIEEALQ